MGSMSTPNGYESVTREPLQKRLTVNIGKYCRQHDISDNVKSEIPMIFMAHKQEKVSPSDDNLDTKQHQHVANIIMISRFFMTTAIKTISIIKDASAKTITHDKSIMQLLGLDLPLPEVRLAKTVIQADDNKEETTWRSYFSLSVGERGIKAGTSMDALQFAEIQMRRNVKDETGALEDEPRLVRA
ncbi:hypothetical protein PHYBLDRAFT_189357 [Phycomyces blakesleeanus NRRL 1555(-)]|uniref:Uncharacterized protein n=1 Tax=Phycomyces blakesleeanus (strain ATCC 8743b / DSM 1359 / FGSC 10004 / NBRC 33097 / NRRL 1555) TaxID=763407 RepID=A0A162WCS1_PHYB8|nr:hypothetical protein PHYBLDRAFT_189357 [Phycomyces blakesleeanus NRRL 1555(-)]OAD66315.1 hypothetical protein PHYBLDRAFT_189357 [Phycomyces blakesleeanus NRRL 1555(-)]|eukprot:XP_018284355.1 hypothetical protein PHYBLDRAFT_189357 [Phycomyces blakesleeanus NRRL 1555(-)]